MHSTLTKNTLYRTLLLTLLTGVAVAQTTPGTSSKETLDTLSASGLKTGTNLTLSAAKSPDHTILFRMLRASGLSDYSSGKGNYTVFAPTNEAFSAFSETELSELLLPSSKKRLAKLLAYHVVKGRLTSDQLKDGQTLTNVTGQILVVHKQENRTTITDERGTVANVLKADIRATNGVVHSIDKVLQTNVK